MVDVTCVSMKKISMINFRDRRLLLNEQNELMFKYRYKGKFKLPWLAPILGNSMDIDEGIFIGINEI